MTRSLKHLLQVVETLEDKGVDIISLRENIDISTATGRCFVSIMEAVSQMERELKSERAAAGREAAKCCTLMQLCCFYPYQERIDALFKGFDDSACFLSLPGVDVILGAKLLVGIGTDRQRFANSWARCSMKGC